MNDPHNPTTWQDHMAAAASEFAYPPTPDLARNMPAPSRPVSRPVPNRSQVRRWAWALAALLLVLVGLWTVPPVRATVGNTVEQLWQIGAVRLRLIEPTPLPMPANTPPATPLPAYPPLMGATTLQAARSQVLFHIPLPAYPTDLGEPDAVYLQYLGSSVVILVWLQPPDNQTVQMSLTIFGPGALAEKSRMNQTLIQETHVHDEPALWVQGEHLLQFQDGNFQAGQLVEGNVLIWTEQVAAQSGESIITYRLESGLSLDQARRIAESLELPSTTEN